LTARGAVEIDGSRGEGGGQILRTALALSCVTGTPVRLVNIRRGRARPGLMPQHLAAVRAAQAASGAVVAGAAKGSTELRFEPRRLTGGDIRLDVGTAGAVTLVLQTLLPALVCAAGPSRVSFTGGTHVPWSPCVEFLQGVLLPALAAMGCTMSVTCARHGFYPAGGGILTAEVRPGRPAPLTIRGRGLLRGIDGVSVVGRLPASIADRQRDAALALLDRELGAAAPVTIATATVRSASPGTYLFLRGDWEGCAAGFTALGAPGKRAEAVGEEAARALLEHAGAGMPVDLHLADQLVPFLALARGRSEIAVSRITRHLLTNLWTASLLLPIRSEVRGEEGSPGMVAIEPTG
jgi:RNA 3'-terminal phosphate cyclase (ATP)